MKGLLTKDFALLGQRKRVFLFLCAWAVVMCWSMQDSSFTIGWMTMIAAFFSISSLTYDEYDNCFPFLMSLPISAKLYVREKFLFGFLCGFAAWLFSMLVAVIFAAVQGGGSDSLSELAQLAIFIPVFMLLIDISLPIHLKYGSEHGRIIVLIVWGVAIVGIFIADRLFHTDFSPLAGAVASPLAIPAAFVLSAALTALSLRLCTRIMQRKEF